VCDECGVCECGVCDECRVCDECGVCDKCVTSAEKTERILVYPEGST